MFNKIVIPCVSKAAIQAMFSGLKAQVKRNVTRSPPNYLPTESQLLLNEFSIPL